MRSTLCRKGVKSRAGKFVGWFSFLTLSGPVPKLSQMPSESAPHTKRLTTRVVKGSLWTLAGQIAPLAVQMVSTPIVIRQLGAESYGALALILIIPQYIYFAELGMTVASTKFGSAAYFDGDPAREAKIIRTAALIALAGLTPVAAFLAFFSRDVSVLFSVPDHLLGETSIALKLVAASLIPTLLGSVFNSPQLSRLRMDLNTFVTSGSRIAALIATPVALHLGYGIVGASFIILAAALVNLICHFIVATRLLPQLFGLTIDPGLLRPLIGFGVPMAFASAAIMAIANLDRGVLSALSSIRQLAYYSVAFTLANLLTLASSSLYQSLVPIFSQLQADNYAEQRNAVYSRTVRLAFVIMIPLIAIAGIGGETIITIFAGSEFAQEGTAPFHLLLIGVLVSVGAYVPSAAIVSTGRTGLLAKMYWLELAPYGALLWLLISYFGAVGAAAAWSTRVVLDALLLFFFARKYAGVRYSERHRGGMIVSAAVAVAPLILYLLFGLSVVAGLAIAVLVLPLYALIVWRSVLEPMETDWLLSRIRSITRRKAG